MARAMLPQQLMVAWNTTIATERAVRYINVRLPLALARTVFFMDTAVNATPL